MTHEIDAEQDEDDGEVTARWPDGDWITIRPSKVVLWGWARDGRAKCCGRTEPLTAAHNPEGADTQRAPASHHEGKIELKVDPAYKRKIADFLEEAKSWPLWVTGMELPASHPYPPEFAELIEAADHMTAVVMRDAGPDTPLLDARRRLHKATKAARALTGGKGR